MILLIITNSISIFYSLIKPQEDPIFRVRRKAPATYLPHKKLWILRSLGKAISVNKMGRSIQREKYHKIWPHKVDSQIKSTFMFNQKISDLKFGELSEIASIEPIKAVGPGKEGQLSTTDANKPANIQLSCTGGANEEILILISFIKFIYSSLLGRLNICLAFLGLLFFNLLPGYILRCDLMDL